jgi:hypothetical protein
MATTTFDTADASVRPGSVAATWSPAARIAGAATMVTAGLLWLVAELIGFGTDGEAEVQWSLDHSTLSGVGLAADMLAVPFLFGAVLVWLLLSWRRSRKLAVIGAVLLTFGLTGQSLMNGVGLAQNLILEGGKMSPAEWSNALGGDAPMTIPMVAFMLMFFVGAFVGIVVMMVAVWRSRELPRTAAAIIVASQVVQSTGVPIPGTALTLVGLALMAVALLRSGAPAAGLRHS